MKAAIVGAGIAGLTLASELRRRHHIDVFEAGSHVGGHTDTHEVTLGAERHRVDTGFIVYNERTYPHFTAMLAGLGVASRPTCMSFSVRDERSGLEYNGTSLNSLFAQRRNLFSPAFLRMVRDILRFNREAPALLASSAAADEDSSLADFLRDGGYGKAFIEHYILPMGAAIWSSRPEDVMRFSARFFIRFFHNHGMLSVNDRPQWRTVLGGSARYVEALVAPFRDCIHLNTPVRALWRTPSGVMVKAGTAEPARYDAVFLACHADQALALLRDASAPERDVLGAMTCVENDVVLHTDASLLPRRPLARAAWNYHIAAASDAAVTVTYDMNRLQGIQSSVPLLVTLNHAEGIAPEKVIKRLRYRHPLFTRAAVASQARHQEINGPLDTYFCGAYWRYGFHEDGVVSALTALRHFEQRVRHA